jgi:hypothetical protein
MPAYKLFLADVAKRKSKTMNHLQNYNGSGVDEELYKEYTTWGLKPHQLFGELQEEDNLH